MPEILKKSNKNKENWDFQKKTLKKLRKFIENSGRATRTSP